MVRKGEAPATPAARSGAPTGDCQRARARKQGAVSAGELERRREGKAQWALSCTACSVSAPRLQDERSTRRRVVTGRVARERARADEVLSLDTAPEQLRKAAGTDGEASLADRTGLRRAQARTRADTLRGPRVARVPPPRDLDDRVVCFPGRRARSFFPLRSWGRHVEAQSGSSTQRFPTPRLPRSGPSGMCSRRSPRCEHA